MSLAIGFLINMTLVAYRCCLARQTAKHTRKRPHRSEFVDDEADASDDASDDAGSADLSDVDDFIDDRPEAEMSEGFRAEFDSDSEAKERERGDDSQSPCEEPASNCEDAGGKPQPVCDIYIHNRNQDETTWSKKELVFELKLHMQSIDGNKQMLLERYQEYKRRTHQDRFSEHFRNHGLSGHSECDGMCFETCQEPSSSSDGSELVCEDMVGRFIGRKTVGGQWHLTTCWLGNDESGKPWENTDEPYYQMLRQLPEKVAEFLELEMLESHLQVVDTCHVTAQRLELFEGCRSCAHCGAKLFPSDTDYFCCKGGAVKCAFQPLPPQLFELFTSKGMQNASGLCLARNVNNKLAFLGTGVTNALFGYKTKDGAGFEHKLPGMLSIHGRIYRPIIPVHSNGTAQLQAMNYIISDPAHANIDFHGKNTANDLALKISAVLKTTMNIGSHQTNVYGL